jgi:hypothetical protein
MAGEVSKRFSHRMKADGSIDSICMACLTTISSQKVETELAREEEDHVCSFAFPARRSGRLPVGVERGRRRSDAEWEKLAQG